MITFSIPVLIGAVALCSAAVGLAVLAIMYWRFTGKLDAAYDDGYEDGLRVSARPQRRHAAPAATLMALEPLPRVPATLPPPAAQAPLPATDTGVQLWITEMRERADSWLTSLLEDARA